MIVKEREKKEHQQDIPQTIPRTLYRMDSPKQGKQQMLRNPARTAPASSRQVAVPPGMLHKGDEGV